MRLLSLPPSLLLLVSTSLAASQQTCYFPDGSVDDGDTPCKSSQGHSACCGSDAVCLSNGLCMRMVNPFGNRLSRGGCTDQSWQSSECPQFCADVATNGGTTIFLGPQSDDGGFCCNMQYDNDGAQCPNATRGSNQPFDLPAGAVQFDRVDGSTDYGPAFGLPASTSSGSTSSTVTETTSATVTVTTSPTAVNATVGSSESRQASTAAVGAGVGVPLGVALLAALGFIWVQRNQKQRLEQQMRAMQGGWPDAGAAPYPGYAASPQAPGGRPGMAPSYASFSGASQTSQSYLRQHAPNVSGTWGATNGLELSHEAAIMEMEGRGMQEMDGQK